MTIAPGLSLDQLRVLLTVADTGSFAAAGRRLNRATSAISYAIDALENQLGLPLFERGGTRKPKLTPAGQAVVAEARSVMHGAEMLRARVKALHDGFESEISLAVDQMFPHERLVSLLAALHAQCPNVPVRLQTTIKGGVEQAVRSGEANIGVGGSMHTGGDGLTAIQISGVPVIPVAAPSHPLVTAGRVRPGAAREHLQLLLAHSEEAIPTTKRPCFVVAASVWRGGDLATLRALLLAGVGWSGMPEPMVREDIQHGRLRILDLPDFRGAEYPLHVTYRTDDPPGPGGRWLIDRLLEQEAWSADTAVRAA